MPFDGYVARSLKMELSQKLIGARVEKIHQPDRNQIVIRFKAKQNSAKLLVSANSSFPYATLTTLEKKNPEVPPLFCMVLRKHLQGGLLESIRQHENDRILIFDFNTRDDLHFKETKRLVVELMGKHSNIILCDENDRIIDSIRRVPSTVSRIRQILPGLTYMLPPDQEKTDPDACDPHAFETLLTRRETTLQKAVYSNFKGVSPILAKEFCLLCGFDPAMPVSTLPSKGAEALRRTIRAFGSRVDALQVKPCIFMQDRIPKDFHASDLTIYPQALYERLFFDAPSDMIDYYYSERNVHATLKTKASNIRKVVSSRLHQSRRKLEKLHEEYTHSLDFEKFKVYGDLLISNLHRIDRNMETVSLENFYEGNKPVSIELDKRLDPAQNAQLYYKKYNKNKNAKREVKRQIEITHREIEYLEAVLTTIEQADEAENIEAIRYELAKSGYLASRVPNRKEAAKRKKTDAFNRTHMTFLTRNGKTVIAGKNNTQNERVTFKKARPDDLWFHAKNIPGSHVVLLSDEEPSREDRAEAAMIAAYYSKARQSSNVPVDCTQVRHVKKIKGAGPGLVTYEHQRTLYVTPDRESIENMKVRE